MILDFFRYFFAAAALLFFLGCAAANGVVFFRWMFQKKAGSTIPIIGGALGCVALFISPWPVLKSYWWIPLILDASYAMYAIGFIRASIKK